MVQDKRLSVFFRACRGMEGQVEAQPCDVREDVARLQPP